MSKGDGCVFKRGSRWWMQFYRDGKQVQMSCGKHCASEDQAKTKLKAEMRKTDEEFVEPRVKRVSVGDLFDNMFLHFETEGLDDYLVAATAKWETYLKPMFANVRAHSFGSDHQMNYRNKRKAEGAAPATVNRELALVRRAFVLGHHHEPPLVKKVPRIKLTKEDNARKGFVTAPQLDALRIAAKKEGLAYYVLLEMAYTLGWRKAELLGLHVSNVSLADNSIRLEQTKNGEKREVPMSAALRVLVEPLVLGKKQNARVFPFVGIQKAWARITAAAGCPEILFHDLRRSSARAKRAAGVDTSVIMQLQGWKTDGMFRRYGIVATEDKLNAFAKQEAYEKALREQARQQEAQAAHPLQDHCNGKEN